MASIVSSVILSDLPQRDGRRWITESHVDNAGVARLRQYLAAAIFNATAALAAYAVQLALDLAAAEIEANVAAVVSLGSLASPALTYSTATQNFSALRQAYQTATDRQAVMIADFLGTLTNAQLQTAFGMTAGQVTTLRSTKLTPAATLAAQIRASTGQ